LIGLILVFNCTTGQRGRPPTPGVVGINSSADHDVQPHLWAGIKIRKYCCSLPKEAEKMMQEQELKKLKVHKPIGSMQHTCCIRQAQKKNECCQLFCPVLQGSHAEQGSALQVQIRGSVSIYSAVKSKTAEASAVTTTELYIEWGLESPAQETQMCLSLLASHKCCACP
jgi:hypothetical protein